MPVRASTDEERRVLTAAIEPLLFELGYPDRFGADPACKIGVAIVPTRQINASAGPGTAATPAAEGGAPCTSFVLTVTEGALARLPVAMLRAVLAHELGHVYLGHKGRKALEAEAEADRFAVALLRRLEPKLPGACLQLVYVFALLGEQRAQWFSTHPSPERRADTALEGCTAR